MMFFVLFVVFVAAALLGHVYDWRGLELTGSVLAVVAGLVIVLSLFNNLSLGHSYDVNVQIYNSLQARIEHYDGTNDPMLLRDIQDWNADVIEVQNVNDSIWLGISIPNSYENFETISYDF